ncbi:hypothetical protein [Streptomyces scabiei]|uniref:hypothetical protein n=1 Tax=Streptomyces scabiei TaxID=1930 RepID=UPI0029A810F0|nr:hypothetical protein [Streptomyces scabiei]MDX2800095.1 hypothetical protein [Streptomyces scabiei]
MRSSDILEQIDAAVDDWATGPDAMRSAPGVAGLEPAALAQLRLRSDITPEQIARARETWEAFVRVYAQAIGNAIAEIAKAFDEFVRQLREAGLVNEDGTPAKRPDRPAWQSPYGPPRRRR